jgi:glycosyltransferase involved in cell wall biosynthesis
MVEDIVASKRIRVALVGPGVAGKTALTHFGTSFAKAMRRDVEVDYVSEAAGEYNGVPFKPVAAFRVHDYDVVHFQWGNNPLHFFEFSTLLKVSHITPRPLIVSTLHEAELGYLIGASDRAFRYGCYFRFRNGLRALPKCSSDYDFFSRHTVAEILRRSDRVIVHSEYTKKRLIAEHQLGPNESAAIHIARLGVDWDDYSRETEERENLGRKEGSGPMVFLYVGSLHSIKSIHKIIKAFHFVRQFGKRGDFYFVVVGSGPEHDNLQQLAETLLPGQCCFAGMVPTVLPYYRLADVVVCPRSVSRGEISGVIPEGCAAGKPIVLPDLGGWTDYVNDSRGFPVEADSEIDYAEALLSCIRYPQKVREKGINARQFAEKHLSWQSQREFFVSLYSNGLAASKPEPDG